MKSIVSIFFPSARSVNMIETVSLFKFTKYWNEIVIFKYTQNESFFIGYSLFSILIHFKLREQWELRRKTKEKEKKKKQQQQLI